MSWRTGATEALSGSDLVSYILAAKHDSCVLDQDLIAGVPGPGELRLASDSSKMAVWERKVQPACSPARLESAHSPFSAALGLVLSFPGLWE